MREAESGIYTTQTVSHPMWLNYDPPVQALLKLKPTKPESRQLALGLEGLA